MRNQPNLFIIGTAKAGTTSMYKYLNEHPDIFFPLVKETHFYSDATSSLDVDFSPPKKGKHYHTKIIRDEKVYNELYAEAKSERYLGDSSPSYFIDKNAPERIYKAAPEAKLIVVLRDPVERAYSQFLMERRIGIEPNEDFLKAVKADYENGKERIWGRDHLYVDHGFYYQQIERYRKYFSDDQILCISFSDLTRNTQEVLNNILNFLNLDASYNFKIETAHNKYKTHRNFLSKVLVNNKGRLLYLVDFLPETSIRFIKKLIFKESEKPKMDAKCIPYFKDIYSEDLLKLKNEFGISQDFYNYLSKTINASETNSNSSS